MAGKTTENATQVLTMAARNSHSFLLLVLLLSLLTACAKPAGGYCFVSTETARMQRGHYDFTLKLDDTTGSYSIRLAARLVASRLPERQIVFDIHTTSPLGETAIERKSFSLIENSACRMKAGSGSLVDCEWFWRDSIRVSGSETGRWRISVTPTDSTHFEAIYGIGISYERNHGKR